MLLLVVLFCATGLWPSWEDGETGTTDVSAARADKAVRVLAFNIAKVFSQMFAIWHSSVTRDKFERLLVPSRYDVSPYVQTFFTT